MQALAIIAAQEGRDMHTIHNERTKYLATALNNLGIGAIMAGIVAPLINGSVSDWWHISLWCVLGLDLISLAQVVLGRLR